MPAQCELIRMEYRGVLVDKALKNARANNYKEIIEELIKDAVLDGVNPWSPVQVRDRLHQMKGSRAISNHPQQFPKITT